MLLLRSLWGWLSDPPDVRDEVTSRRAALLLRLVRFVLLCVPFVVVAALLDPVNTVFSIAVVWGPTTAALLAIVAIVRSGHHDLAGWLISVTLWLLVSASVVLFGGVMGNNAVAYVIVVMVAGAALGPRMGIAFAAVSAVAAGLGALVEHLGYLPQPILAPSLTNGWIAITVTLVGVAALHNMAIRSLDVALTDASAVLARLRDTRHENETRGLHGAALARLAERALLASDPHAYCADAAGVVTSLLGVDVVFLVDVKPDGHKALVPLHPSGDVVHAGPLEELPFDDKAARVLRIDDPGVRPLLERLGAGVLTGGLLVPVHGRTQSFGFLGVAIAAERPFSMEEERFLSTLATLVASLWERNLASDRAQRAQKLEVIGRLAGSVAHDFNNLLTVIMGTSDAVRDESDAARRAELADELDQTADRARLLTRQLLAFSRKQVVTLTRLDLGAQVEASLPMMRRLLGAGIELESRLPSEPVYVTGDAGSVDQIVLNLLVNAREAMPDGGVISVSVAAGADGGAVLTVSDTGVGMDDATRRSIFQPFFTTKAYGTGLGLATVADIAQRHGAVIDVDSAPGRGATFTIRFPAHAPAPVAQRSVPGAAVVAGGRALLAEDHPLVRASTARMLRALGFDVVAVPSGREAREVLRRDRAFQVLVTDVLMPDVGGQQLVDELARDGVALPVVFISGYADSLPTSPIGPSRILPKPFTRAELGEAISACLPPT
ncbi:ATP-binding protein [Myxococcota bacterium]|nr:ATP-binding protein [Myxococcota bacterium]